MLRSRITMNWATQQTVRIHVWRRSSPLDGGLLSVVCEIVAVTPASARRSPGHRLRRLAEAWPDALVTWPRGFQPKTDPETRGANRARRGGGIGRRRGGGGHPQDLVSSPPPPRHHTTP